MCCRIPHREIGMVRKTKMPAMNQALLWVPTCAEEPQVTVFVAAIFYLFVSAAGEGGGDEAGSLPCLSAAPRCRAAARPPAGGRREPEPAGGSTSSTLRRNTAWWLLHPQPRLQTHPTTSSQTWRTDVSDDTTETGRNERQFPKC